MPSARVRSSSAGALASVVLAILGCSGGGSRGGPDDTTAPTVVSRFPADGATGVWPAGAVVTVTFSEAMDPATLNGTTFLLRDTAGAAVAGAVGHAGTMATLTPASPLAWLTAYTATVTPGARDTAGNALSEPVSWTFTTAQEPDTTAPIVSSHGPAANAVGVPPDVTVTVVFSEPMEESSTSAAVSLDGPAGAVPASVVVQGATATLTPAAPLAELTTYTATVSGSARDLHGNALAAGVSWSFTVADATTPSVTSVYPPDGASNLDVGTFVDVLFSEQMNPSTVAAANFQVRDPSDVPVAGTIRFGGNGASFFPGAPLAPGTAYRVALTGATDLAGNPLPAFSSVFTTTGPGTGSWTPMAAPTPLQPYAARADASAVWTGAQVVVWGGWYSGPLGQVFVLATGGRYAPSSDSWQAIPSNLAGTPPGRSRHATVWTGSRMIVWGGSAVGGVTDTGGVYDPSGVSGSWAATPTSGAPAARADPAAVWTGTELIVWGGWDPGGAGIFHGTGGRYAEGTGAWTATSEVGAPSPRVFSSAVWTGTRLLVWGGLGGGGALADGASYDPAADTWEPMAATGAPSPRWNAGAVWTGSRMIVWGGADATGPLGDGAAYDPATDTWSSLSASGAPPPRERPSAVWTGTRMIVWGGAGTNPFATGTGGVYDPGSDTWALTALAAAPSPRRQAAVVWTGTELVVWSGWGDSILADGARLSP